MKTRGEAMLALRRSRMAASPAFLRGGFRPFFLGAALWAAITLYLWIETLAGHVTLASDLPPLAWHRHEMLFGAVGAAVAGFLLTAIPNWTGRLPIAGAPLASLFALWAAARLALLWSATLGIAVAIALDVGFYLLLAALAGREVLKANNRNLPVIGLLALFGLADALDYAAALGLVADEALGARAAVALVTVIISLIGGRIIPSFTRNWLAKRGAGALPGQPTRFDVAAIALTGAAMVGWAVWPLAGVIAPLLLLGAAVQIARLGRWQGYRAAKHPLVLILHLGYAWIPAGMALLGLSILLPAVPQSVAVHALTAGAMGTMILAVMTRATLGHTARPLVASGSTVAIYALVTAGALLRLAAPWAPDYMTGLELSALIWGGAFILFALAYGPMLIRPRLGEKA